MNSQSQHFQQSINQPRVVSSQPRISSAELAAAINQEHRLLQETFRDSLNRARRLGELLIEVKAVVKQTTSGRWLLWLEEYCPEISERTARAYMQVAKNWNLVEQKSATVADLCFKDALKVISRQNKVQHNAETHCYGSSSQKLQAFLADIAPKFNSYLTVNWEDESSEQFSQLLSKLANLELTITQLRKHLKEQQMSGSDNCPRCGEKLILNMESCLCGWNTGTFPFHRAPSLEDV